MKTAITAFVLSVLCAPAFASDILPLPQSLRDLYPVTRQEALPAAPSLGVGIPNSRLLPDTERAKDVIRLAPGKSQTVALSRDASSVIVANPAHASVFLDNSRLLIIVPRAPGATGFTVLDREGKTIMNQQIVVDQADDPAYVRVTRICGATTTGSLSNTCFPSTLYFCPDNCVPVSVQQIDASAQTPVIPPVASMPSLPPIPGGNTGAGAAVPAPSGMN